VVPLYVLTIPGVVIHELAHQFVAELFDLRIEEVDYTSHVIHEAPKSFTGAVLVSSAPLVVNTALAVGGVYVVVGHLPVDPASFDLSWVDPAAFVERGWPLVAGIVERRWQGVLAAYVVFALLFRAMPSLRDVENIFDAARRLFGVSRPQVLLGFLLLLPILGPLWVLLRAGRVTDTRVVVDLGYAALVLALLTGVRLPPGLV
jgi:hypothetical protein